MDVDQYNQYFKHQAITHPALLHADETGRRVFEIVNVDEFSGDFRCGVKEKGYIMRLLEYSYHISDMLVPGIVEKVVDGGFLIAHYYSARSGGKAEYVSAKKKSELVVDSIIEKMLHDSRSGHPVWNHSMDSKINVIVNPVDYVGDASYVGYMALFSFRSEYRDCITDPSAPAWTDGGNTPHDI